MKRIIFVLSVVFAFVSICQAEECYSDYNCGIGYRCIKNFGETKGVCMKEYNEYNTPTYNLPRPDSVGPRGYNRAECHYDAECPYGSYCDDEYKVCIKGWR